MTERAFTRKRRGALMHKNLEFDCEEDRAFWEQAFFQEDEGDAMYEEESSSSSDEVDSDFDDADEVDEDGQAAEKDVLREERLERRKDLKKTKYVDPAAKRKKQQQKKPAPRPKKTAGKKKESEKELAGKDEDEEDSKPKKKRAKVEEDTPDECPVRRSCRPQTAAKSTDLQRRMEWEQASKEYRIPRARRNKRKKTMSKEDRLREAEKTAAENTASLAKLLHREEEEKQKRRAAIRRRTTVIVGPAIRLHDSARNGEQVKTVSFRDHWPEVFCNAKAVPATPPLCCITGRKMRYRDPLSGQPYADQAAFNVLRKCYELLWSSLPIKLGGGKSVAGRPGEVPNVKNMTPAQRERFNTLFPKYLPALLEVHSRDPDSIRSALQKVVQEIQHQHQQSNTGTPSPVESAGTPPAVTPEPSPSPAVSPPLAVSPTPSVPKAKPMHVSMKPDEAQHMAATMQLQQQMQQRQQLAALLQLGTQSLDQAAATNAAQQVSFPAAMMADQVALQQQHQQLLYQQMFGHPHRAQDASGVAAMPVVDGSQAQPQAFYGGLQYYNPGFAFGTWNQPAMQYHPHYMQMLYPQQYKPMVPQASKPPAVNSPGP